jgi:hypothetical protein
MQKNTENQWLAWAEALRRDLLGDVRPQALAILLAAGWSALAAFSRDSEKSMLLGEHLHESMAHLREEITRPVEVMGSLLDLARQLLLSNQLLQPFLGTFPHLPPRLHPSLGPLQKEQANLDALAQALNDYQTAALRYTHELGELFEAVLSEYQQELSAGVQPESLSWTAHERHDHWLEVAERTYERFLGSEAYTQAVGALMNAWAGLRLALRPVVDELLLHMGLPTGRDVDDMQVHLDRLRRQQRADTARLKREITALRDELAALRGAVPDPPLTPRSRRGDCS